MCVRLACGDALRECDRGDPTRLRHHNAALAAATASGGLLQDVLRHLRRLSASGLSCDDEDTPSKLGSLALICTSPPRAFAERR